jgi:hydrogenase maturation protease
MILVIGYGNTLRGDDGIGPRVAVGVAERRWPDVRTIAVAQLTPELAEPLAEASMAVFIDASFGPEEPPVTVASLRPAEEVAVASHVGEPRGLLALARTLYGTAPPAWLVTVTGVDFGLGETLSAEGRCRAQQAQDCVERLLTATRRMEHR